MLPRSARDFEMAFACPNWEDNVVEINTDSVFVIGEDNAVALRKKAEQMLVKYEMLFEGGSSRSATSAT